MQRSKSHCNMAGFEGVAGRSESRVFVNLHLALFIACSNLELASTGQSMHNSVNQIHKIN